MQTPMGAKQLRYQVPHTQPLHVPVPTVLENHQRNFEGEAMNTEDKPILTVIPSSDQKAMGLDLMNDIRDLVNSAKYDHMTVATVIGVLEMTKLHYWSVN
jgi:hypothetical protein